MPIVIEQIMTALCAVTQQLPIGTNLALLQFLWMLVSGTLLSQRGALFPSLLATSLPPAAIRRAWAAFRYGSWSVAELLVVWAQYVTTQTTWQASEYEGYRPKAVDLTAFWRPRLQTCPSKHYHTVAGKALPAIVLGIVGVVGRIGAQRVILPTALVRVDPQDPRESTLQVNLLHQVAQQLALDEVAVLDAGFKIAELQAAGITRYVVRLAENFTARRNVPAPYQGRGRKPTYGTWVRPLARRYKDHLIAATPPDQTVTWQDAGLTLRAEMWTNLILPGVVPDPEAATFTVVAIYDPRYTTPWLLATPLPLHASSVHKLYQDRWPVEQIPLAAKHMIGAHRQFVSAPESCQRLPELALLAGSFLTVLAATLPPIPTGFWDRHPQPTPGRLRRALTGLPFPDSYPLPGRIRKKASLTAHLLTGVLGHRRSNQVA